MKFTILVFAILGLLGFHNMLNREVDNPQLFADIS